MKKSKLMSVLAMMLVFGIVASACSKEETKKKKKKSKDDEEIEEIEDDEDEEETKKSKKKKKSKETEEDPTEEVTTTTEEETTTTEEETTTTEEETTTTADVVAPAGTTMYTLDNMTYYVDSSWEYVEIAPYQYNFLDAEHSGKTFLMFCNETYNQKVDAITFSMISAQIEDQLVGMLQNGKMLSSDYNTDGPVYYDDVLAEGTYVTASGSYECTLACRSYMIPETGEIYYMFLFAAKDDEARMDEIMKVYNDTVASATFG